LNFTCAIRKYTPAPSFPSGLDTVFPTRKGILATRRFELPPEKNCPPKERAATTKPIATSGYVEASPSRSR
jgi:hypothetical protein